MIGRAVAFSARHPTAVLLGALLVALLGAHGGRGLVRDVLPDLADPQIVLVADWMEHPAAEVAAAIGDVLTGALDGLPGAIAVRASSMTGMAFVEVVFAPSADLAQARRAIVARVAAVRARLPDAVRIDVGPPTSSASWVFQYALVDPSHGQPPLALRRLQDDRLRPVLAAIPGVAEVASVGGAVEELLVETQSDRLAAAGVAFSDVVAALGPARAARPTISADEIAALPIELAVAPGRPPPRIADVARVRPLTAAMPGGLADLDGLLPAIGGIVIADRGADLATLIPRVRQALEQARAWLPPGVRLVTVTDRLALASRVADTLAHALVEEIGVVVLVVLLFLLHGRSALVPLVTLPVVLLLTLAGMRLLGVPATIMSLGGIGIALGMAVDADLVALEACHRRLEKIGAAPAATTGFARRQALIAAAGSFAPAILISLLIAAVAFLPVWGFTDQTGRLLRPLALTKTLVIAAAALVSITLAPALRDRLLRGRVRPELGNPLTRALVAIYRPFVRLALARPALTLATAGLAVLSCVPLLPRLGAEFLPRIDEGDLLFMPTTRAGVSPHQAASELRRQDQALASFPEVARVFGKVGRADTATDPAPFSMAETTIQLRPRSDWPRRARPRWYSAWAPAPLRSVLALLWPDATPATSDELIDSLDRATRLPGWSSAWTAPVRARIDMTTTGVRTPVGIRLTAADPARLAVLGAGVRAIVAGITGARSATLESPGGEDHLTLVPDVEAMRRHQVDPALAQATAALVLSGGALGDVRRDGRVVRLRVTPEVAVRGPADQLRELTVRGGSGGGQPVALGLVARPQVVTAAAAWRSEGGARVAYVYVDLPETTNLLGYVAAAQRAIETARATGALTLRAGEGLEWIGQYPILLAGQQRLRWVVPAALLSMLLLLVLQFRSVTEALIVLASVPFALVGSVWTLFLCGYPLSAPVWVGLLSTVGLAMQTGVLMVVYIDAAFHARVREGRINSRDDIVAAHAEGTVQRLRPKIMTITTMAAGLLPFLWAQGAGAEIMRRVAAPMVGGLLTSAFLTLEVLPVLHTIWRHRQLRRAQKRGVSLGEVLGRVPPWAGPDVAIRDPS